MRSAERLLSTVETCRLSEQRDRQEVDRMREDLVDLKCQRRVFHATKCAFCGPAAGGQPADGSTPEKFKYTETKRSGDHLKLEKSAS